MRALLVVLSVFAGLAAARPAEAQSFTYFGDRGPAYWGTLAENYVTCQAGSEQSPADVGPVTRVSRRVRELTLHYGETHGEIFNNGYTVEVETEGENELEVDGRFYRLVQFHFHTPSEHRLEGEGADMELHLVHRSESNELAVVGLMLKRGPSSGSLAAIFDELPPAVGPHYELHDTFNPRAFLPASLEHYRYDGSLTTPPCTEGVRWFLLSEVLTVSDDDMARFAAQVSFNARPTQRRFR